MDNLIGIVSVLSGMGIFVFIGIFYIGMLVVIAKGANTRMIDGFWVVVVGLICSPLMGALLVLLSEKKVDRLMKLKLQKEQGMVTEERYVAELIKLQ